MTKLWIYENHTCELRSEELFKGRLSQLYCYFLVIRLVNFVEVALACVASVSVWFLSKKRRWKGIFGFDRARNETRTKKWKRGEGEGKKRNACRQTPRFWKPTFASERSTWLARLVKQYWRVSIKGFILRGHVESIFLSRVEGSMSRARVPCWGSRVTFFFPKTSFFEKVIIDAINVIKTNTEGLKNKWRVNIL